MSHSRSSCYRDTSEVSKHDVHNYSYGILEKEKLNFSVFLYSNNGEVDLEKVFILSYVKIQLSIHKKWNVVAEQ
jgi:hypothetical protein